MEGGQNAAPVQVTVLGDFVDGATFAEFADWHQHGLSLDVLRGEWGDFVPGLALAGRGSLHYTGGDKLTGSGFATFHVYLQGVVDRVVGVVIVEFSFVEHSGSFVELQLQLSDQGAFVVDNPQRFIFADIDAFNLNTTKRTRLVDETAAATSRCS